MIRKWLTRTAVLLGAVALLWLVLCTVVAPVVASYATANYMEHGGASWVVGGNGLTGTLHIEANGTLSLEGATADAYELTIGLADPTADVSFTLPNDSGYATYVPGANTLSAADSLAIPVTHSYVAKTTGADAEALTLANGENGQLLTICLVTDGNGDGTLTPTTCSGFATIVFADAGDGATLLYVDDTVGWVIAGLYGVSAPPATTQ